MRFRSFLPLVLLLASCRSERVAFVFAPDKPNYACSPTALARPIDISQSVAHPLPGTAETTGRVGSFLRTLRPRQAPQRRMPGAQRSSLAQHLTRVSTSTGAQPAASTTSLAGRHPAERALLVSGAVSTLGGLLINSLVSGSASLALLSVGHYLLVVGTLLLLAWFILLLLRAVKEV